MARPSSYCAETTDTICDLLAHGKSLVTICKLDTMPHYSTVMDWIAKHPEFAEKYARAREAQAEYMAEEILSIADDDSGDALFTEDGKRVMNSEFVARSRLRVDSRKWLASKLLPKKYGDYQKVDQTTQPRMEELSDEQLDSELKRRAAEAGIGLALGGEGETEA